MPDGYAPYQGRTSRYVRSSDVRHVVQITQAAFDALDPPDPDTLYVIID